MVSIKAGWLLCLLVFWYSTVYSQCSFRSSFQFRRILLTTLPVQYSGGSTRLKISVFEQFGERLKKIWNFPDFVGGWVWKRLFPVKISTLTLVCLAIYPLFVWLNAQNPDKEINMWELLNQPMRVQIAGLPHTVIISLSEHNLQFVRKKSRDVNQLEILVKLLKLTDMLCT